MQSVVEAAMTCRICDAPTREILDLGTTPPANALTLTPDEAQQAYPLVLEWCETCGNVQLRDTLPAAVLYRDYLYATPQSASLEAHYGRLIGYLRQIGALTDRTSAVEIGSNAGHFLRHLCAVTDRAVGVDPAREIADAATKAGLRTVPEFFDRDVARRLGEELGAADLVVARHCLAHNKSPHDMLSGVAEILARDGYLLIENAYIANTIRNTEFDQVYHEHMFYFSLTSMRRLLQTHDLELVDAFLAPVHGGSVVFVASRPGRQAASRAVDELLEDERALLTAASFERFRARTDAIRRDLRTLVLDLHSAGSLIYAYGATAKGNTLLNATGLTRQEIPFSVDSTPMKHGRFLPGSRIEVIPEQHDRPQPDYYLLTAWNYQDEIIRKVRDAGDTSSRFILPIPEVRVI